FCTLIEEGQVRTRLAAGGRWIRTIGTAKKTTLFGCPRSVPQFAFRNKNRLFRAGTDGSNPSPSSEESNANLMPTTFSQPAGCPLFASAAALRRSAKPAFLDQFISVFYAQREAWPLLKGSM